MAKSIIAVIGIATILMFAVSAFTAFVEYYNVYLKRRKVHKKVHKC